MYHAVYPLLLRFLVAARRPHAARKSRAVPEGRIGFTPRVSIIVPAYREQDYIARKIADLVVRSTIRPKCLKS